MNKKEIFAVMVIGKTTPSVTYDNYFDAEVEAERLVKKERLTAYILKAVCIVELTEVVKTRLDT
jgi:hypothetical protein